MKEADSERLHLIDYYEILQQKKKNRRNWVVSSFFNLSGVHFGYFTPLFNMIGSSMVIGVYGYRPEEKVGILANVNSLFGVGCLIGVLTSGKLAETFGRRTMIISYDIFTIFTVLLYMVKDLRVLYLTRVFSGICSTGGYNLSNIMTAEYLPKEMNAIGNSLSQTSILFFVFLSYMIGIVSSDQFILEHWRIVLGWTGILSVIKLVGILVLIKSESPKYYLTKNPDAEDREERLMEIYRETHSEKKALERKEDCIESFRRENAEKEGKSTMDQICILFSKTFRKRMIAGSLACMTQQLSGHAFFEVYSKDLFDKMSNSGTMVTFCLAIAKFMGGGIVVLFVKYFGRKKNIVFGTLAQGIGICIILVSLWLTLPILACIGIMVFITGFQIGSGGCCYLFSAEILPPIGVSVATSGLWILDIITMKITPHASQRYGDNVCVGFFCLLCFVMVFTLDYFIIETRNKSDVEIIDDYQHKKYRFMDFS